MKPATRGTGRKDSAAVPPRGTVALCDGRVCVVTGARGDRVKIRDSFGRLRETKASALEVPSPSFTVEAEADVAALERSLRAEAASLDTASLWELLLEDEEAAGGYDEEELFRLMSEDGDPRARFVFRLALAADPRFYLRKGRWVPQEREKVMRRLEAIRMQEELERRRRRCVQWLSSILDAPSHPDGTLPSSAREIPHECEELVERIRQVAILGEEARHYADTSSLFKELNLDPCDGAFETMVRLGVFSPDENVLLHRYEIPFEFPPEVEEEAGRKADELARSLAAASECAGALEGFERRRIARHTAVAIDDEDTADRDDALFAAFLPDGRIELWIHVADCSAAVRPGGLLHEEASRRGCTIYLPDRKFPMLPPVLSERALALREGGPCRSVAARVVLDPGTGGVQEWEICRCLLERVECISYDEADARLAEEDPLMKALETACEALGATRGCDERTPRNRCDLKIRVRDGRVQVKKLDLESPARRIVSEAMILANTLTASMLKERGVPCIYRGQREMVRVDESTGEKLSSSLEKVGLTTEPIPHESLGVGVYTQATSPLRRFLDLLMQQQIDAVCRGETPHGTEYLEEAILRLPLQMDTARRVEQWSNRYWLLKYFEQHMGRAFEAVVVERRREGVLVELPDYLLKAMLYAPPDARFSEGEHLMVKVGAVRPRKGWIRFEPVYEGRNGGERR